MSLPDLPGLLSPADLAQTAATVAEAQEPDGAIPWFPGGHTDAWDHVECAMALDVAGLHEPAVRAYEWLRRRQRADGSWAARYDQGVATQSFADANFCGYVAVGVWHHYLATGSRGFLQAMWPTVHRALGLVVRLQRPGGEIAWACDEKGPAGSALLTSSSSLYQSLRAGLAIAGALDQSLPDWELAAGRLGHAVRRHPERFENKHRWSMDWYYPVLGGAVRGAAAAERIASRWDEFWVDGLGIRCVADRPWVTGAETCELALTLNGIGNTEGAVEALSCMQHLRHDDGSYWTGYVFDDGVRWPVERSTWTAAAVILAADAIAGTAPASGVFRDAGLPLGVDPASVVCPEEEVFPGSAVLCRTAE